MGEYSDIYTSNYAIKIILQGWTFSLIHFLKRFSSKLNESHQIAKTQFSSKRHSVECLNILKESVKVKVTWSHPALCNPMDYTVHGILQARILEWVAIPFYRGSSRPSDQTSASCRAGRFSTFRASREVRISHK